MNPQISFIIPARNEKKAIPLALKGLIRDAARYSYEIIIVDDASAEARPHDFEALGPVRIFRNSERLGAAKSMNIGARQALGETLIFLDAHVCFSRGWLEELFAYKKLFQSTILGTAIRLIYGLEEFQKKIDLAGVEKFRENEIYYGYRVEGFPASVIRSNFKKDSAGAFQVPYVPTCAMALSRELFMKIGEFEDELTGAGSVQDLEFCMRAWALGYEVAVIPSIVCYHCYYEEKAKKQSRVDPQAHPFQSEKYAHSLENAVRVYYLQSSEKLFGSFLEHHGKHPGFKLDLEALLNEPLKKRRMLIERNRKRSSEWVFDRMGYTGAGKRDHESGL